MNEWAVVAMTVGYVVVVIVIVVARNWDDFK